MQKISKHEQHALLAIDHVIELCCFIRSHDASYTESCIRQAAAIKHALDNLVRYAEAIEERINL
jgi:hypothetical protein